MSKMMVKMRWATFFVQILVVFFAWIGPNTAQAQSTAASTTSVRRNIATIIFCGVGGAVLGISTLSFYGDPQNHIGNITTGFALGLIGGATYVTMQMTEAAKEQAESQLPNKDPLSLDPIRELSQKNRNPRPSLAWSWDF